MRKGLNLAIDSRMALNGTSASCNIFVIEANILLKNTAKKEQQFSNLSSNSRLITENRQKYLFLLHITCLYYNASYEAPPTTVLYPDPNQLFP